MRPKIKMTLVDRKGDYGCHKGYEIGKSWDFDEDRGEFCSLAMHTLFPMVDILRYGGELPKSKSGDIRFACPDADVINIFRIEKVDE